MSEILVADPVANSAAGFTAASASSSTRGLGANSSDECCDHKVFERTGMPDEERLYELADLFKIFADTTRIKILYALMNQELCVAHIAEAVGATQSAVSHQLRILKRARLVKFRREGRSLIYSLSDNHVHTVLAEGMDHICE